MSTCYRPFTTLVDISKCHSGGQAVTGDAELDALMEEIGREKPPSASAPQEDAEEQPTSKPKKKKKGKAAAADSEDIDALLAQLDGPPDQQAGTSSEAAAAAESPAKMEAEPAAETGKGKKKKKKGKAGAKGEEEDLDAVLAELGMAPAAKPEAQPTTDAEPQASDAAPADEAAAAADDAADDNDAAAAEDGKVCVLNFLRCLTCNSKCTHVHGARSRAAACQQVLPQPTQPHAVMQQSSFASPCMCAEMVTSILYCTACTPRHRPCSAMLQLLSELV